MVKNESIERPQATEQIRNSGLNTAFPIIACALKRFSVCTEAMVFNFASAKNRRGDNGITAAAFMQKAELCDLGSPAT